jgi:hypothetical protein
MRSRIDITRPMRVSATFLPSRSLGVLIGPSFFTTICCAPETSVVPARMRAGTPLATIAIGLVQEAMAIGIVPPAMPAGISEPELTNFTSTLSPSLSKKPLRMATTGSAPCCASREVHSWNDLVSTCACAAPVASISTAMVEKTRDSLMAPPGVWEWIRS